MLARHSQFMGLANVLITTYYKIVISDPIKDEIAKVSSRLRQRSLRCSNLF